MVRLKGYARWRGRQLTEAGPAIPVTILGLDGASTAGDKFKVYEDEKKKQNL